MITLQAHNDNPGNQQLLTWRLTMITLQTYDDNPADQQL